MVWLVVMSFVPIGHKYFKTATAGGPFTLCWAVDSRISTAGGLFVFFFEVHETSQLTYTRYVTRFRWDVQGYFNTRDILSDSVFVETAATAAESSSRGQQQLNCTAVKAVNMGAVGPVCRNSAG